MSLKSLFTILLLLLQSFSNGQGEQTLVEKGNQALASRLWEVAAQHFEAALQQPQLDASAKSKITILLTEAWIRDGAPQKALDLLSQPFLTDHPDKSFWLGQSLAAMGRFAEAVKILTPVALDPQSPYQHYAGFTIASLNLALGDTDAALAILASLTKSTNPALAAKAQLRQTAIMLDLDRQKEARETMPKTDDLSPQDRPLASLLNANLLLNEGQLDEASTNFRILLDQPQNQSIPRYHAALIGLSDTLRAKGDTSEAADLLLNFIQDHTDSPQLEEIFKRLLDLIPETPTPNDPILERLSQWIPPYQLPITGLIASHECLAISAWPTVSESNDLLAFSLYTRAIGVHRLDTPEAKTEARRLVQRLRMENPNHFLASRALLLMARWDIHDGNGDRAFNIFQTLRESATSPLIRGEAAFIQARRAYENGDPSIAIALFKEASDSLTGYRADLARYNARLLMDANALENEPSASELPLPNNQILIADLTLERAISQKDPSDKRSAIEDFLLNYPTHPRVAEARIRVAEAALSQAQPDLSFAQAQIDTLSADPDLLKSATPAQIAFLQLQINDRSNDPTQTIENARTFLTKFSDDSRSENAAFILGRNLFQTGSYNDARIILEKLATTVTDPSRAQAALLLAARSAALVPTSQSKQEALTLFDKSIATQGPVSNLAKLEKARLMIDIGRLDEVTLFLREWFSKLDKSDSLYLPAGLLLGESIYANGSETSSSLAEALQVYDQLIENTPPHSADFNRLQYLRGKALEQLPSENNPTSKRDKEALVAYYSVIERNDPPEEWEYFELAGFRALALLESARRWPAAIACAKKIASFHGPRAEEAAARASQLQLKHMIWED